MKLIRMVAMFAVALWLSNAAALHAQIGTTVALTGTVLDELTRQPVSVTMTFYDTDGKKINSTRSNEKEGGAYYVILKPGQKYVVNFDNPNYMREERSFETPNTSKYAEISRDWVVRPMRAGIKLPLTVSPFEYKKAKFRAGAEDYLNTLRNALIKNPSVNVEIQCYPDLDDSKDGNIKLTQERANALKDFFAKGGVSADRVVIKASGDTDPVNPPPLKKGAKGKRYVGSTYIVITKA